MASDTHRHHQPTSSRLGPRHTGGGRGEIVEVQGGHIVRSIGRKDRHSKVCTAKGPRDRRVRLSAHTAIQFYDVQDRLGFDRPSKAVDWLIKKAKPAIDELAQLPAWNPSLDALAATTSNSRRGPTNTLVGTERSDVHPNQQQPQQEVNNNSSSFLPASLDSDAIADTIKSFFPMGASAEANSSPIQQQQFHNFPPPDLLSRTSSQSQDLRLSLHSFQDPILLQLHHQQQQQQNVTNQSNEQGLFSGTGYDSPSAGWSEHQTSEINRFQRMVAWNATGTGGGGGGGEGFVFNSPPTPQFFGQNQFVSQRGPLQSSNTPSVRAWIDPISTTDHHHHHQHQNQIHQSSFPGIGFASVDGFSGFRIPARIQGEQEEHDGISDKPSSASSDSRH